MDAWGEKMRFDEELPCWCLDPDAPGDPANFTRERVLLIPAAHVLDHAV